MTTTTILYRLVSVLLALSVSVVKGQVTTYRATITEIEGTDSNVTGFVSIFTDSSAGTPIGYAGIVRGLPTNLLAATCNVTNGCGVHIHNGTDCTNNITQGGHYYVATDTVTADPWTEARYSSNDNGTANFYGVLDIGTNDVDGRVFLGTLCVCG
jgi:hypothetical protein